MPYIAIFHCRQEKAVETSLCVTVGLLGTAYLRASKTFNNESLIETNLLQNCTLGKLKYERAELTSDTVTFLLGA